MEPEIKSPVFSSLGYDAFEFSGVDFNVNMMVSTKMHHTCLTVISIL
jgi:hypothetical protein